MICNITMIKKKLQNILAIRMAITIVYQMRLKDVVEIRYFKQVKLKLNHESKYKI